MADLPASLTTLRGEPLQLARERRSKNESTSIAAYKCSKGFSSVATVTVNLYDKPDPATQGVKNDTLSENPLLGDLLTGSLSNISRPAAVTDATHPPLTLYFDNNSMEDLWLAITWGKS
jgi:hypothetical protein